MNAVDAAATTLLAWLGETAWQAALLVLLVLLAQRIFRRWLSPRARHALWLLVVARLVIPSLPPAPWSVFNLTDGVTVAPVAPPMEGTPAPVLTVANAPDRSEITPTGLRAETATMPRSAQRLRRAQGRRLASPINSPNYYTRWLFLAWLVGALTLLVRISVLEWRFAVRLRTGVLLADEQLLTVLRDTAKELGVRRCPTVVVTHGVEAPALYGTFRPRLLLPPHVLATLTEDELRCVFRHELAHLKSLDAPLDRLATLLECIHWFNPAVWFAMRRMREERENARDQVALRSASEATRQMYGYTVIRLIECCSNAYRPATKLGFMKVGLLRMSCSKEQLKRRISMIANPIRPSRRTTLVAFSVAAMIGLATLTGASQVSTGKTARAQDLKSIRVTPFASTPEWERTLHRQLERSIKMELGDATLSAAIDWLRTKTEINFVIHPDTMDVVGDEEFGCDFPQMPIAKLLDLFCETARVEYGLKNGAVYFAPRGYARTLEKRAYNVRELLASVQRDEVADRDEVAVVEWADHLQELLSAVVGSDGDWEREGVRKDFWRGALIVTQTAEMHTQVHEFLTRLLNRGYGPRVQAEATGTKLSEQLAKKISVAFEDTEISDVVAFLKKHGLPVLLHADIDPDTRISLRLRETSLADALVHIAALTDVPISLHPGIVRIGYEDQPMHLRYHDVAELLRPYDEDDDEQHDSLLELISVSLPGICEPEGSKIKFWNDLMLVRQSESGQREVKAFLDAIGRALKR